MSLLSPIELLQGLRHRSYFAPESWGARGLLPSDPQVIARLEAAKCALIDELITAHKRQVDRDGLYAIALKDFASCLDDSRLDTEECEFLGDCIADVARAANINRFLEDSEAWMMNRHC